MVDKEKTDLLAQIETLTQEKSALLDELESAYQEMETFFEATQREQNVTYQALRARNRDLQHRLEELEKAHQDLKDAQQLLIRSERLAAMGEMAAAIVHEIKNPLNVILGRLELIRYTDEPPSEKDLDSLHRSAMYLLKLTENILGFSREHQGEANALNLNALIDSVVSFVQPLYKGVEISQDLSPEIPAVWADATKVEQVIMNLVLNAVDAMDQRGELCLTTGTGTIDQEITDRESTGRIWTLAVNANEDTRTKPFTFIKIKDNGPGIAAANLPRIFEAFFTTKEKGKGTGLGLSIVRTIVEEWGGDILLDSKESAGATFCVFVPIAPDLE